MGISLVIEWGAFLVVAIVSLVAASAVVTVASLGMRLHDSAIQAQQTHHSRARLKFLVARILFGLCGLIVLYGVYLIIPAFH